MVRAAQGRVARTRNHPVGPGGMDRPRRNRAVDDSILPLESGLPHADWLADPALTHALFLAIASWFVGEVVLAAVQLQLEDARD